MAKIFRSLDDPELIELIQQGAVGVIPTDTVYGLVTSVLNRQAVERMYALKRRERKPGTTIAASVAQLEQLGIAPKHLTRAAAFWPNSISIIMPPGTSFAYIHQGVGDSPFRVVQDETLSSILQRTGPLLTSSANQPGERPAGTIAEAQAYFGDHVDFYVDGGVFGERPPSTIVRFDDAGKLQIIRQGAVVISNGGWPSNDS
jgi:L-threonylcarbamoyladenylate synthase